MNKRQIAVQKQHLKNEKAVIRELKDEYKRALSEINDKIAVLQAHPETQAKVYQIAYQTQLKLQVSEILDKMNTNNYQTIEDYLNDCYKEGFIGAMYDIQGQGVPLTIPIDQSQAVKAVKLDSKISHGLYGNMKLSIDELKKRISSTIARGVASGLSYEQLALQLERATDIDYNKALRIIRTEGHRIQNQSALDAMTKARDCGAEVVKQWDATLDDVTRPTHQELDDQVVGVDEEFVIPSTGARAMTCGGFGDPAEDCNCRCCVLQRAKWNMDDYDATKLDNQNAELKHFKEQSYNAFKTAYFKAVSR